MAKQYFNIGGMTCSGCERTLERAVSRLEGVRAVRADRQEGQLEADFSPPCTSEQIIQAVQKAGYEVTEEPQCKRDALYLLVILLGLYVIAEQLGWTDVFLAFPAISGQRMGYLALFLTGLLTSVHCIAMCGGLNLAQSMNGEDHRPIRGSILYNLGRLSSYTLIGGILGLIGEAASITLHVRGIIGMAAGIFMLLMGICMLSGFSLPRFFRFKLPKGLTRRLSTVKKYGAFSIGLVNGFMPCGPLQSMQLYAIASGSFLTGAASMFFFCLGTIPLVLLFGATAGVLKMTWRKRMLQLGCALLILMGLFTVQNNLALTGMTLPWAESGSEGKPISASVDGDVQYVTTTLRANGFDDIQVVEGIPVVWTILADADALNGCNQAMVLPAFDQQIQLEEGANTITFTPEEAGDYSYSCWMGMLRNTITVIEQGGSA